LTGRENESIVVVSMGTQPSNPDLAIGAGEIPFGEGAGRVVKFLGQTGQEMGKKGLLGDQALLQEAAGRTIEELGSWEKFHPDALELKTTPRVVDLYYQSERYPDSKVSSPLSLEAVVLLLKAAGVEQISPDLVGDQDKMFEQLQTDRILAIRAGKKPVYEIVHAENQTKVTVNRLMLEGKPIEGVTLIYRSNKRPHEEEEVLLLDFSTKQLADEIRAENK
jgi:hypothetical protein